MSIKMLAIPPLLVMVALIFLEVGSLPTAPQGVCIESGNNAGACGTTYGSITCTLPPTQFCTNVKTTWLSLIVTGNNDLVGSVNGMCTFLHQLAGDGRPPPPASCGQDAFGIWNGQILLAGGQTIKVTIAQTNFPGSSSSSIGAVNFFFKSTGPTNYGYAVILFIGMGVVAIAGLTVFGTTFTSGESAHILFVAGLMVGLWVIFSLAEGFVVGAPTSVLQQMNGQHAQGQVAGFGTAVYGLLSLIFTIGVIGLISRGE